MCSAQSTCGANSRDTTRYFTVTIAIGFGLYISHVSQIMLHLWGNKCDYWSLSSAMSKPRSQPWKQRRPIWGHSRKGHGEVGWHCGGSQPGLGWRYGNTIQGLSTNKLVAIEVSEQMAVYFLCKDAIFNPYPVGYIWDCFRPVDPDLNWLFDDGSLCNAPSAKSSLICCGAITGTESSWARIRTPMPFRFSYSLSSSQEVGSILQLSLQVCPSRISKPPSWALASMAWQSNITTCDSKGPLRMGDSKHHQ